ncbi:protein CWC16 [Polyplax serrata]|uniref:Splicing factor YJU2 n=1 Tax=Polyplax serrata TaxID=468196 RepID=A0AAN8NVP0_POLSC
MSERKVLNKYYPPDFDPSKIPRMKLAKNRQYTVRLMAPFNMRCATCGEYIYKGKKFNARKEDVEGEDYLGIRIFRFYIKCTRCLQEISFRTDPKNTDYEIEAGATRNFMALKLAEEQAQREKDERVADEATNPMKLLENRTKQSKQELELLESLEELKDLNKRQRAIDYDTILSQYEVKTEAEQELEDEEFIKSIFKKEKKKIVVEEIIEGVLNDRNIHKRKLDDEEKQNDSKISKLDKNPLKIIGAVQDNTNVAATSSASYGASTSNSNNKSLPKPTWGKGLGGLSQLKKMNLVKVKTSK